MKEKPNVNVYIKLRDERGFTNYKVHKLTGVAQQTLSSWERGNYFPKRDKIGKLAELFNVPVEIFYRLDDEMTAHQYVEEALKKMEPAFDVAAGQGRINEGYNIYDIHDPDGSEYSTIRICGDSMFPVLHNGDLVRVHHVTDDISPSALAVVKINGDEATIKHVEYASDGIWLKAENKEVFPDKFFSMQECLTLPVQIIGVATELISRKL